MDEVKYDVVKIIKQRSSIRTFNEQPLSVDIREKIKNYIKDIENPFSIDVSFRLLETKSADNSRKLGTYGVIKGANSYIGASVADGEWALEAVGYSFEKIILYATSLGLGTCWLGGTFNRGEFASAMDVKQGELFPAITPIGYPLDKKRFADTVVRKFAKSDTRKDWNELFFKNDFSVPLSQKDASDYEIPLEMIRLAPSASNKQPWRIVQTSNGYHFYEDKAKGYSERLGFDIQRIDIGIAACHFHLAAQEKGLSGKFEKLTKAIIQTPSDVHYLFSWIIQ